MTFQHFGPVSRTGKGQQDDVIRLYKALRIAGHTPQTTSRFINSAKDTVIAGVETFQRQNRLKIDGMVNPVGPTERALKTKVAQVGNPVPAAPTLSTPSMNNIAGLMSFGRPGDV